MTRGFDAKRLLPPNEALERYFTAVALAPPQVERVSLDSAPGRILAQRVDADDDYPSAPRSAMDGFAVRAASTPGTLRLVGDISVGSASARALGAGEAMRIPTGGVLPSGADAVVPAESVTLLEGGVTVPEKLAPGDDVIGRGADMHAGETLLDRGRRIGSPEISVLATLGFAQVPVYRRPVVAVLSSGDEIVEVSQPLRAGEVRDSNRYAIAASLEALGASVHHGPIVRDDEGALEGALRDALEHCDAAVISGGSSVGARDRTPHAVASLGDPGVVVHGLRVRPGKPTLLGAAGAKPVIGLPGNPLSATMMLESVAAPILCALTGAPPPYVDVRAELRDPLRAPEGWTWYVPVRLENETATPLTLRSFSASLAARASGYAIVGENGRSYSAGEQVAVRLFLCGGAGR